MRGVIEFTVRWWGVLGGRRTSRTDWADARADSLALLTKTEQDRTSDDACARLFFSPNGVAPPRHPLPASDAIRQTPDASARLNLASSPRPSGVVGTCVYVSM